MDPEIRPQRLSKPRTSTSSSNLLNLIQQKNESSSPLTPTDGYGFGDNATIVTSPTGEVKSRRDTRSKLREYLYGPNNQAQPASSEDEDDGPKRFAKVAGGLKKRLSRRGSSFTQLPSAKSSSLYLTNSSGSRLLLSSELSTLDFEESERIAEAIKEKAYADSIAAHNHVASPVDEDKHPDSVMAPIRRRSLFLPGIATRDANDILRKPPIPNRSQSQVDLAYYYNPLLSETSPLAQLAALDKSHDGRSTPSDLDYSHLGALKLGTLRVTNGGAASPAPDTRAQAQAMGNLALQHGHYTANQGGGDDEGVPYDDRFFLATRRALSRRSDSQVVAVDDRDGEGKALGGYADTPETGGQRGESPLDRGRPERLANSGHNTICKSCLRSLSINGSMTSTNPSSRSPDCASIMAQDYMSELPGSPFSKSEAFGVGILEPGFRPEIHSLKDGIAEDEGLDTSKPQSSPADMWRFFINDVEVRHAKGDTREDAFRTLTANAAAVSDQASRSVSSSQSSRHRQSLGTPLSSASGKSFKKADSGYDSNESLQTLSSAAVGNRLNEPSARLSRSISGPREMPRSISSAEKIDIPGDQPDRPAPIRPSTMVTSKAASAIDTAVHMSQTSSTTTVTVSYLPGPSELRDPATQIGAVPRRDLVKQSRHVEASTTKAHKLHKARPLSQPLPVDLITLQRNLPLVQADIPPVPFYVSSKHADRVRDFPLLEHTVPSSQYTDDISIEKPAYMPIRFPSPADAEEESLSNSISITTRLSQHSTRESNASPSRNERESTLSEEEEFPASDLVRSPSWSDFGRRGRKKKRFERERRAAKKTEEDQGNGGLDEDGFPISEICRSPSWSAFGGNKKQKKRVESDRKRSEKSPKKEEAKRRSVLTRKRSSKTVKDERRSSQPSAEATIADFGTVTESLGGSPYDIARAAFSGTPRAAESTSISHPHQMSTAMPRAKSTIGMDEEHAAEFARLRSRQRSHSSSRPEAPMWRSFDERTVVQGRAMRPQSMYADIPPVPTLPQNFGQPSNGYRNKPMHSRSRSMFPEAPHTFDVDPIKEPESRGLVNGQDGTLEAEALAHDINLQPTPAFALVDLPLHRQVLSNHDERPAGMIRPRSMIIEASSRPDCVPGEYQGQHKTFNDRGGAPGRNIRPKSIFLDVPPVPALPTAEQVEQKEAQISRSSSEKSMTLVGQRKPMNGSGSPRKDLWESAALVEDNANAPRAHSGWEAHELAWADHRKSAGDALLQKNQASGASTRGEPATIHAEAANFLAPHTGVPNRSRTPSPSKAATRPFHKPLIATQHMPPVPTNPAPPPPSTTAPSLDRLAGRYEGGLSYGYEPGVGVGGSAGTRSAKTGASRKSIGFSQGYGVDLSDIPIFVAPRG